MISNKFLAGVNNQAPFDQPQSLTSLEKNLFPSLEPSEVKKVDEEFDRITNESSLDSLLSKGEAKLDALLEETRKPEVTKQPSSTSSSGVVEAVPFIDDDSSSTSSNNSTVVKSVPQAINKPAPQNLNLNLNSVCKPTTTTATTSQQPEVIDKSEKSPAPLAEAENGFGLLGSPVTENAQAATIVKVVPEAAVVAAEEAADDDLQDEIHFDPTISSGQLGFKEVRVVVSFF